MDTSEPIFLINTSNNSNTINTINTRLNGACGSDKKYKNCCGK